LRDVLGRVEEAGWAVAHVDATVVLERPKLAPHRDAIRESLASVLGSVNVKFTTGEKMGFVGREEGAAALAVATLEPALEPVRQARSAANSDGVEEGHELGDPVAVEREDIDAVRAEAALARRAGYWASASWPLAAVG
jgi:hypothetical protein